MFLLLCIGILQYLCIERKNSIVYYVTIGKEKKIALIHFEREIEKMRSAYNLL